MAPSRVLFADDAGSFFVADEAWAERCVSGSLTAQDQAFLALHNMQAPTTRLDKIGFEYRKALRQTPVRPLNYLMLIPTLRCNLACTYCQVSRAPLTATGFDWTDEVLGQVLKYLDGLEADAIKIEFQGGEPFTRLDLLERVRTFCRERFAQSEFVVCTNLDQVGPEELRFLEAEDTFVSTSLDGPMTHHDKNRTQDTKAAERFFSNLRTVIGAIGIERVSALPTIDIADPPDADDLIDTYAAFGFNSIFLRPINYQGFARKRHGSSFDNGGWSVYFNHFIDRLIERNASSDRVISEFYLTQCLKRILSPGYDNFVNLRNPCRFGQDNIIVDHDGRFYPTDEARMLSRIGTVDLSIGSAATGIDQERLAQINTAGSNEGDPDCEKCTYQAFCGSDPVDNISRYGRADVQRHGTWFCNNQLMVFDRAMKLLYSRDEKVLHSLKGWLSLPDWPFGTMIVRHDTA